MRLIGADVSFDSIEAARAAGASDQRLSFQCTTLDAELPFPNASLDLVYSHNLLECPLDPGTFVREVAQVL